MFVLPQEKMTKHGGVMVGRVWWHEPVIIATQRLRQDCEFKADLGHTVRGGVWLRQPRRPGFHSHSRKLIKL